MLGNKYFLAWCLCFFLESTLCTFYELVWIFLWCNIDHPGNCSNHFFAVEKPKSTVDMQIWCTLGSIKTSLSVKPLHSNTSKHIIKIPVETMATKFFFIARGQRELVEKMAGYQSLGRPRWQDKGHFSTPASGFNYASTNYSWEHICFFICAAHVPAVLTDLYLLLFATVSIVSTFFLLTLTNTICTSFRCHKSSEKDLIYSPLSFKPFTQEVSQFSVLNWTWVSQRTCAKKWHNETSNEIKATKTQHNAQETALWTQSTPFLINTPHKILNFMRWRYM